MGEASLSSQESRTGDANWVRTHSFQAIQAQLPLRWPVAADTSMCRKLRFRSQYVYQGWADLQDQAAWEQLNLYELLLRLIDFSSLRPVLAQLLGWHNDRGWRPFDPISIFLLKLWQLANRWNRSQTIQNLTRSEYAAVVSRMGFAGAHPTEGGLRYIETCLGNSSTDESQWIDVQGENSECMCIPPQPLNELIAQSIHLLYQAGIIDPDTWQKAVLCPDGMLHQAASRLICASVQETCYQPAPRSCPAQQKGKQGCDCQELACRSVCCCATPRDPQARFIWYSGSNQRPNNPNQFMDPAKQKPSQGKGVYGYRSLTLQLCDPQHRFNLSLLADFQPANCPEMPYATAHLLQLARHYPSLRVEWVSGDAAFGFDAFLHTIYAVLHARRVVDIRAHETDQDKTFWPTRGYDAKGRPICPFGYALTANGFDPAQQRHKWTCEKACQKALDPCVRLPDTVYPPPECPYQSLSLQHGKIVNLAERFADGSIRLARDVPVGSSTWKKFYHQARNASEARNAFLKALDLKRLPVFGVARGKTTIFLADVWRNLSTLARLIREATLAAPT